MSNNVTVSIKFMPAVAPEEVHPTVHKAINIIDSWGIKYEVGPSNTTLEGNLTEILGKIDELCKKMSKETSRFAVFIDIDYCDEGISIEEKIEKYR
jgi:uncharacterized protein YqgV (UPF0045/DUF77 family)